VWHGSSGSRKAGIKFGIDFNYDGYALGNISMRILDTYDWPMWSGSVNVNLTALSLAKGGAAAVRITINFNADVTLRGGQVSSSLLELDGRGLLRDVTGPYNQPFFKFGEYPRLHKPAPDGSMQAARTDFWRMHAAHMLCSTAGVRAEPGGQTSPRFQSLYRILHTDVLERPF
jgi:hypothetical protein